MPRHELSPQPSDCRTAAPAPRRVFIDTETLGLVGIPFLIQIQLENAPDIDVIHVFDTPPDVISHVLAGLAGAQLNWVGHNLMFDIAALSKLATIAAMVQDWSFESIWQAERLWRGEVSYEERLQHLRLLYPSAVEDTLIAARSLPPLEEQFMKSAVVKFSKLPVAVLPDLKRAVQEAVRRRSYYSGKCGPDLANRLRIHVADAGTRAGRDKLKLAQRREDFNVLKEVTLSFRTDGLYGLKPVARLLGFPGPVSEFNLLDDFGRMPDEICPTIRDRELAERLYNFVVRKQHDPAFLDYARRDIELLRFVHGHYANDPGYPNLQHNFRVLPFMANLRLYGVHIDGSKLAETRAYYSERKQMGVERLRTAGLANHNSGQQVLRFVNQLLRNRLAGSPATPPLRIKDSKEKSLVAALTRIKAAAGPDDPDVALLSSLIQVRKFSKRMTFFDSIVGDTLYPEFQIKGTQTDRMTSQRPSVQNMPNKSTDDEDQDHIRFREIFTAPSGYEMLVGDFDQFEMRLVAAVAHEPSLIEAFQNNEDTHALTALRTMQVRMQQDRPELAGLDRDDLLRLLCDKHSAVKKYRSRGKVLNFAVIYGASEHGVAHQTGMSVDDSRALIRAFHQAYPLLSADIARVHGMLTVARTVPSSSGFPTCELVKAQNVRVANLAGVTRAFELPLRLIQVLMRMAVSDLLGAHLPILQQPRSACVRYYDRDCTPVQVIRSQLRSAARQLQAYVHRQAYNFCIQSLGAYYTKQLQSDVAGGQIAPGIHRASDLRILPGINVHDELHIYATPAAVAGVKNAAGRFVEKVSSDLGVPIRFGFERVDSWAAKS